MTTTFAERVDQLIANKSLAEKFSGVVLVKRDENEWFQAAYGYANRTWRIGCRVDTRFRIASISKLFTAVAVLQLIEEGKLSLDTRVAESLDLENATIPKEATVHHMLTMTSGIADWFEESGDWEENWAALCREHPIYLFRRNQDYLPLFIDKPALFPLGEKHQYNGAGYILLGLVIEKLSGLSYFDYIRRHIFEKAEMTRSDFLSIDGDGPSGAADLEDHASAGVLVGNPAGREDVAIDVERPHRGARGGDEHEGLVDVVAPDADVHVRALAFDGVVPAIRDDVAVDVGVAVGAALETEITSAADAVVVSMIVG